MSFLLKECNTLSSTRYILFRGQRTGWRIVRGHGNRRAHAVPAEDSKDSSFTSRDPKDGIRVNEVGIQQLSPSLHRQVFPQSPYTANSSLVTLSQSHLLTHELLGKQSVTQPPVTFTLPTLEGKALDEHFYRIGMDAAEPYLSQSKEFANSELPPKPQVWRKWSGWTRYDKTGEIVKVDHPLETCTVFDCEVLYKESPFPIMACAASSEAWYGWISPWLLKESRSPRHLIPFGSSKIERIIVGHNVGYDRQKIKEEYNIYGTKNTFLDTMSLHVAVNGMCSQQRPTWLKHQKKELLKQKIIEESTNSVDLSELLDGMEQEGDVDEPWIARSSINSLLEVAQLHCNIKMDKSIRDYFGQLDRDGVLEKFDLLMDYCAGDVAITHQVFKVVLPAFLDVCPHPVSFAGLIKLANVFLPVDSGWEKYILNAEKIYRKLTEDVQKRLVTLCEKALRFKTKPEKWINDPWLRQLDWGGQEVRMTKPKKKGESPVPVKNQKKPGMPNWYKGLFASNSAEMGLTVRTRIAPLLLRLSWEGNPLVWSDKYGWVFRVTDLGEVGKFEEKHFLRCDMSDEPIVQVRLDQDCVFFKIPHKDGPLKRVANPMAKGYLVAFEEGLLTSEFEYAKEALDMNAACSYWISARERIKSQMVIWDSDTDLGIESNGVKKKWGMILPQIIPMGTITRRAVENTWLTASNAKKNRVGSELKAMIKAPNGWSFVGADVDSEELWIASLMGDAEFGIHGATALGWMTLEGTKAMGTDLHSKTASILGISRNDAKVFNYGRIYGAGLKFAIQLLHRFNPSISESQAEMVATKLYESTKGSKSRSKFFNSGRPFWRGGTESVVFNKLEDIAEQEIPRTPILGCAITEALMRRHINKGGFMPSRINWAIQSSGVDYLHLLIVSMEHLCQRFGIKGRLLITVHDEIRYMVKEEDIYRGAMALQISNLWTRAMFSQQMGIDDVPQGCAFFSTVDIDHVLRKEVDMDCITPSHKAGIPSGKSIDIFELLKHLGSDFQLDQVPEYDPSRTASWPYIPRQPVFHRPVVTQEHLEYLKLQIQRTDGKTYLKTPRRNDKELRLNDWAKPNFEQEGLHQRKTPKKGIGMQPDSTIGEEVGSIARTK